MEIVPRPSRGSVVGAVTRGTTNPNRLRRVDRWLAGPQAWRLRRAAGPPVVVDLGYGASPVTTVELWTRLTRVRADVTVIGIEIDPDRVAAVQAHARPGLSFAHGGFEIPVPGQVQLIRAFNVLRQYPAGEVPTYWAIVAARLAAHGLFIDGTCDEIGRLASWVAIEKSGPTSLTLSWRLRALAYPSQIAERLPKVLIHRNVPGERIHDVLRILDVEWAKAAAVGSFGARQRFAAMAQGAQDAGVAVLDGPSRWRLGELTLAWDAVRPD